MMLAPSGVPIPLCVGWRYACISGVVWKSIVFAVILRSAVGMPSGRILPLFLSLAASVVVSMARWMSCGMSPVAIRSVMVASAWWYCGKW